METAVIKLYEAMFLVDSTQVTDWDGVVKIVKNILKRADAQIVSLRKWDERKLAYEINHKSRGTYALCYFRASGDKIRNIEKDVQLSEQIMRVLILSAETREKEALEGGPAPADSQIHQGVDSPADAAVANADIQPSQQDAQTEYITEQPSDQTNALEDLEETDQNE